MRPAFLNQADDGHRKMLMAHFPGYQILLIAGKDPVAVGHTVPLYWDQHIDGLPDSIENTLVAATRCLEKSMPANTLAALSMIVSARWQDDGLSERMLLEIKRLAREQGMTSLIVPVRPRHKTRYPLAPFSEYVTWRRVDGSPFDPSIRLHWKAGASVLKTAPRTMTVNGTVNDWENWTDMRFAESGEYIVDGALRPVLIDLANDYGWYEDPSLWMHYPIDGSEKISAQ